MSLSFLWLLSTHYSKEPYRKLSRTNYAFSVRISKTTHLTRLLQTLDVVAASSIFLISANFALEYDVIYIDWILVAAPAVVISSIAAALILPPKLGGQKFLERTFEAIKTVVMIVSGILIASFLAQQEVSRLFVFIYGVLLLALWLFIRVFLEWYYFRARKERQHNFLKVLFRKQNNTL